MASNYGWAKKDILENVYIDELFIFTRLINQRKISDYKMQLAIATNPNTKEPKRLWAILDAQENSINGKDYVNSEFDPAAFEAFKQTVQRHGGAIVVK